MLLYSNDVGAIAYTHYRRAACACCAALPTAATSVIPITGSAA